MRMLECVIVVSVQHLLLREAGWAEWWVCGEIVSLTIDSDTLIRAGAELVSRTNRPLMAL